MELQKVYSKVPHLAKEQWCCIFNSFTRKVIALGDYGALWGRFTSIDNRYGNRTDKDIKFGFCYHDTKTHKNFVVYDGTEMMEI